MPASILNLKFKGNKSFVAFSNLGDSDSLTKTWKACTKVACYLEQGQRLENLSWRLWHLQNLIVESDNARSKREFKKLSKCIGDRLDKEKGRNIQELEAPGFKRNQSTDKIRLLAEEKERHRETSQNARPGTIKRMQFTFSVDNPTPMSVALPVKKPDLKPSQQFKDSQAARPRRPTTRSSAHSPDKVHKIDKDANEKSMLDLHLSSDTACDLNDMNHNESDAEMSFGGMTEYPSNNNLSNDDAANDNSLNQGWNDSMSLRFPSIFSNDFGPSALLYPPPSLSTSLTYGEGMTGSHGVHSEGFTVSRPTIELPLDELLNDVNSSDCASPWSTAMSLEHHGSSFDHERHNANVAFLNGNGNDSHNTYSGNDDSIKLGRRQSFFNGPQEDVEMKTAPLTVSSNLSSSSTSPSLTSTSSSLFSVPPMSQAAREVLPTTIHPSQVTPLVRATHSATPSTTHSKPLLSVKISSDGRVTRSSGPSATAATSLNPAAFQSQGGGLGSSTAPGGVKAECSNCGATHTPLWRRGLNDELNCNACGLYCKLHKRPRPKSMRNNSGEGRAQTAPRHDAADVMGEPAQCYNCHTMATPLWRKDDEGKTVCNACGLYYKLHGSARPISMKSDVIRKRSRHDARRVGSGDPPPSASPGASRRASPSATPAPQLSSPELSPDMNNNAPLNYNGYQEDYDFTTSPQSELMGALGAADNNGGMYNSQASYDSALSYSAFPGPYHPDYLQKYHNLGEGYHPFSTHDGQGEGEDLGAGDLRSPKRRRMSMMSTDSASEPPSSTTSTSYSNYTEDTTSSMASHSHHPSLEFPFSTFHDRFGNGGNGIAIRNAFWHPPMLPHDLDGHNLTKSPQTSFWHPPMLPQELEKRNQVKSPQHAFNSIHPPMLPPAPPSHSPALGMTNGGTGGRQGSHMGPLRLDESPMDFLHPPMLPPDEELFASYLHPPMVWSPPDSRDSPMTSLNSLYPHPPMVPNTNEWAGSGQGQKTHGQGQNGARSDYYEQSGQGYGGYAVSK